MMEIEKEVASSRRWVMPSNRGWESFECTFIEVVQERVLCKVSISGQFWRRAVPIDAAVQILDFQVDLPQVNLDLDSLRQLLDDLVRWRDGGILFSRDIENAGGGGQSLRISLIKDSGVIHSLDKPVFYVEYCSGLVMTSSWRFVVDQSCVQLAIEGLAVCLDGVGAS